jgi:uncharacterized membrane protein YdjX (TVP38/TMEM64 family)
MKGHWGKLALLVLIVSAAVTARFLLPADLFDIQQIQHHKEQLISFIASHYLGSVLCFMLLCVAAALFLPGALVLTVAGGMVFGTGPTVLYANLGATAGAVIAFITARYLIGEWVQQRFAEQLRRFNDEVARHGRNYLLTLRILPIAPACVVNYCAGITRLPLKSFVWTTSLGMLPGSAIYAFLGHQLRFVTRAQDLVSWKIVVALCLLAAFALLPVIVHHFPSFKQNK